MAASNFFPKSEYGQRGDRMFLPGSRLGLRLAVFASCTWPLSVIFLGAGCATPSLMPTPNLYGRTSDNPFANVPPAFRTNTVDVLYLTDRAPDGNPAKDPRYGLGRSLSLAFGMTTVCIGKEVSWDDLVTVSRSAERRRSVPMSTVETREVGIFPPVPTREVEHDGQW